MYKRVGWALVLDHVFVAPSFTERNGRAKYLYAAFLFLNNALIAKITPRVVYSYTTGNREFNSIFGYR